MKEQTQRLGTIKITNFGLRHFDPKFGGTKINPEIMSPKDFEQYLNSFKDIYFDKPEERMIDKSSGYVRVNILDGYAPFCKLLVMANITQCRTGTLPKTIENAIYIRHGFSARTESELPVPSVWLDLPVPAPAAKYTVSVLYSKAQIDKEAMSIYNKKIKAGGIDSVGLEKPEPFDADWGVVAILGQMTSREEPMKPITMLRNALGVEEGGSGVPIDREAYMKSVKFWSENLTVK